MSAVIVEKGNSVVQRRKTMKGQYFRTDTTAKVDGRILLADALNGNQHGPKILGHSRSDTLEWLYARSYSLWVTCSRGWI